VIFSGGMPIEKAGHTPTMTIMRGSSTTVLEMDHTVIDFVAVCSTPWNNGYYICLVMH
jgi:syntaxin-binding protein 5